MNRMFVIALTASLAVVAGAATRPGEYERAQDPGRWHRGPVRYILTIAEDNYFGKLESDEQRLEFIERFWGRRDPNPSTAVNEYRIVFWERVVEANRRFMDTAAPGWKTDRGKIFILLGEPDQIEDLPNFDTEDPNTATRGLQRWHYRNLPVSKSLDPETVVAFVRDNSGDFRLSTNPKFNDIYFDALDPYGRGGFGRLAELQNSLPFLARSELSTALDLGRLQQVPTEDQVLREYVLTQEFYGTIPAQVKVHRFPTGGDDLFVTFTVILRKDDLDPPFRGDPVDLQERFHLVGRMIADDGRELLFGEADFHPVSDPEPADPTVHFQARRSVPPGRYRLSLAAFDQEGRHAATVRRDLAFSLSAPEDPALSDLVLASRFRDRVPAAGAYAEPYLLGDLEVLPRGDRPLARGDRLRVYFQVRPPSGGTPVALRYRFERRAPGATGFEPVGSPRTLEDAAGAQTWDVPLETFPEGRYRIVVEASAGDGTAVRTLEFEVGA